MEADGYIRLRQQFSQFCVLDDGSWEVLRKLFIPMSISKSTLFGPEGQKAEKFGWVSSGYLRMYNLVESGNELTKHFLCPGDFFVGTINYTEANTVSIQALTHCEILVADFRSIDELSKRNPIVGDFKNNLVSSYVLMKQRRENRYLSLEAMERYQLFLKDFPGLLNEIPHHYIASYLGVSATQLSRVRKKLTQC